LNARIFVRGKCPHQDVDERGVVLAIAGRHRVRVEAICRVLDAQAALRLRTAAADAWKRRNSFAETERCLRRRQVVFKIHSGQFE
jgi:hypothetical protein